VARSWEGQKAYCRSIVGRAAYTVVRSVTLQCIRGVIGPLYHCRHSARDYLDKLSSTSATVE